MPSVKYSDLDVEMKSLRDWRQALRTPPTYRVGNSTLRIQTTFVTVIALLGLIILFILYTTSRRSPKFVSYSDLYRQRYIAPPLERYEKITHLAVGDEYYNATYPLTPPVSTPSGLKYRIGIISDLDTNSKSKLESNTWVSYLKTGYLIWHPNTHSVAIIWDRTDPVTFKSTFGHSGRGMELSELLVFNGKLISFDDRTGLIYEINLDTNMAIPWVLLMDGNGLTTKGFKSEWATVKDHRLYVGSMGKEWTTSGGELVNNNPMWIKTVTISGQVSHINWEEQYKTLRRVMGVEFPGYIIHESGVWSDLHQRWFFLPRRLSKERFNDEADERMSTNILLSTDQHFTRVQVTYIGEIIPTHGFSSFKFLPGTDDTIIVALKSEEDRGKSASYVTVFHIDGKILLPETKVADLKYEGIEFI
ncbi:soluble calcium-activated nucleotidase 1-like [Macrosteles quadrilineatus]|uniref:soluble calcium-activated nucleotidase 1-like n=1 Tax=Macrosteles quadrilineatus TaxID=74068 RepID=UPI0023E2431F|nr:soluble calcium-activated nucleotidase 1-like [Macrosteles quadrilineatus]